MGTTLTAADWRAIGAEFFATLLFVFLGPGAVIASGITAPGAQLTADKLLVIAIGHGLAIAVLVWASAHVSGGHINPAVTFAAWITGRISLVKGVLYIVAQLVGAVIGSALLMAVIPDNIQGSLGAHGLGTGMTETTGLLAEIILTFALVGVVFMTAMHPKGPGNVAPLAIGLVVLIDHLVGVPLTGASMNPARSFGPALVAGAWASHWIYWVGPLVGGAIGGLVAHYLYLKPAESA